MKEMNAMTNTRGHVSARVSVFFLLCLSCISARSDALSPLEQFKIDCITFSEACSRGKRRNGESSVMAVRCDFVEKSRSSTSSITRNALLHPNQLRQGDPAELHMFRAVLNVHSKKRSNFLHFQRRGIQSLGPQGRIRFTHDVNI